MSRYTPEQVNAWRAEAQACLIKLEEALVCVQTANAYGLEDYLVDAAVTAVELSDKVFDAVHELCPVCEGNDVLVEGKPDICPACDGERSVTHGRADRIRENLKDGTIEAFTGDLPVQAVTKLLTVGGKEL